MTPRFLVIAHHVCHLFPDVVSGPMTHEDAQEAANNIPGRLPPCAHGWTVNVERVGAGAHPKHLYRED